MKNKIFLLGILVTILVGICIAFNNTQVLASEKKSSIHVGVYDSRAIMMAYTWSKYGEDFMPNLSKEKHEAEAKGDIKKAKELGKQLQREKLRKQTQVFSTAPVNDLLDLVKDKLPEIAKQAGVDLIVSKWQINYLASDAEVVDITIEMAKAFDPKPGTMEKIEKLMEIKPLSEEEVEKAEKQNPH